MLREENICHEDIALMLENLPNLTNLVTYSYVGRSLRYIYKKNNTFQCKLRYVHDTDTSPETLDAIVSCCPELENIYLDTPTAGILGKLAELRRLQQLKLYKFCCNELDLLLQNIGFNLHYLTVIKGKGVMDISRLAQRCPALVDLDCYLMELLIFSCDYRFEKIEGLEILNSCIGHSTLKNLIAAHSNTIQRLAIDTIPFSDDDLTRFADDFRLF